jgi:hypothetical protein
MIAKLECSAAMAKDHLKSIATAVGAALAATLLFAEFCNQKYFEFN